MPSLQCCCGVTQEMLPKDSKKSGWDHVQRDGRSVGKTGTGLGFVGLDIEQRGPRWRPKKGMRRVRAENLGSKMYLGH